LGTNKKIFFQKFNKTKKNNINYAKIIHSCTTVAVVQGGAVNIHEATVDRRSGKKGKTRRNSIYLSPNLLEKLVWVPVISLCKILILKLQV
jgi:hypothetical protein